MREIKSGDTIMRVRASNLAVFFYKQEFRGDILKAFSKICKEWLENDALEKYTKEGAQIPDNISNSEAADLISIIPDAYEFFKIVWALNKAQNVAEKQPTLDFDKWLAEYSEVSVLDILEDVIQECMQGFFRFAPNGKRA